MPDVHNHITPGQTVPSSASHTSTLARPAAGSSLQCYFSFQRLPSYSSALCLKKSSAFQQWKNSENRSRLDKVSDSLKVGTFLRHSVVLVFKNILDCLLDIINSFLCCCVVPKNVFLLFPDVINVEMLKLNIINVSDENHNTHK